MNDSQDSKKRINELSKENGSKRSLLEHMLGNKLYTTLGAATIAAGLALGSPTTAHAEPKGPRATANGMKPSSKRLETLADQLFTKGGLSREDANATVNMIGQVSSTMRFVNPKVVVRYTSAGEVDYTSSYVAFNLRSAPMAAKRLVGVERSDGVITKYAKDIHSATNWKGDKLGQLAGLIHSYTGKLSQAEGLNLAYNNIIYFAKKRGANWKTSKFIPPKSLLKMLRVMQDNHKGLILTEQDNGGIPFDFMLPCGSKYSPITSAGNQSYKDANGSPWCHIEIHNEVVVPFSAYLKPCTPGKTCKTPTTPVKPTPRSYHRPASGSKCTVVNNYHTGADGKRKLIRTTKRCGDSTTINIYNTSTSTSTSTSGTPAPAPRKAPVAPPKRKVTPPPKLEKCPYDAEIPKDDPNCKPEDPFKPGIPPVRVPPQKPAYRPVPRKVTPPAPKKPEPKADSGIEGKLGVGVMRVIPREALLLNPTSYMDGIAADVGHTMPMLEVGLGYDFGTASLGLLAKGGYMEQVVDLGTLKGPYTVQGTDIVGYTNGEAKAKIFVFQVGPYVGFDLTKKDRLDISAGVAVQHERYKTTLTEHQVSGEGHDIMPRENPEVRSTDVGGYVQASYLRRLGKKVFGGITLWYQGLKGGRDADGLRHKDSHAVGGGLELKF